jgi:signal transduction histidine kinase
MKYNQQTEPHIEVSFSGERNKRYLCFADNGIGFEKREMRKIFKKFYQIGRVDDMTAKGSGLGLYLVQTIAKIHRWRVTATSAGIGKGSVFTVIMPARQGIG